MNSTPSVVRKIDEEPFWHASFSMECLWCPWRWWWARYRTIDLMPWVLITQVINHLLIVVMRELSFLRSISWQDNLVDEHLETHLNQRLAVGMQLLHQVSEKVGKICVGLFIWARRYVRGVWVLDAFSGRIIRILASSWTFRVRAIVLWEATAATHHLIPGDDSSERICSCLWCWRRMGSQSTNTLIIHEVLQAREIIERFDVYHHGTRWSLPYRGRPQSVVLFVLLCRFDCRQN